MYSNSLFHTGGCKGWKGERSHSTFFSTGGFLKRKIVWIESLHIESKTNKT